MEGQWNIGDVVRLKSGGPLMTVDSINGDGAACSWFTEANDGPKYSRFKAQMLMKAAGPPLGKA